MDLMQNEELNELLSRVKCAGSMNAAFSELVIRYTPMMRSRVLSMFGDSFDFNEAMQEASLALHDAAKSYDSEKCEGVTFGLYASVCVCNRLRSLLRKKRRDNSHSECFKLSDEVASGADVENFVANRDLCERVLKSSSSVLSELEYEVFSLELEGCSTREIALRLSRSPKSVDNAKARIAKRLKLHDDIRRILSDF